MQEQCTFQSSGRHEARWEETLTACQHQAENSNKEERPTHRHVPLLHLFTAFYEGVHCLVMLSINKECSRTTTTRFFFLLI